MAGFKTHITTSSVLGIGYGAAGYLVLQVPLEHAMLAAGLCSLSGMLPDLDSDSGIPVRETITFGAAIVPMLMIDRFQALGLTNEMIILAGGLIYLGIRFGVAEIFKRYTVHRGMWHSIPAAAIAGLLAFLVCSCDNTGLRLFKTAAVVLGFLSHLVLDEIYSIDLKKGIPRLKKSSGTALKLWSKNMWGNVSTYGKLVALVLLVLGDPILMESLKPIESHIEQVPQAATDWINQTIEQGETLIR